MAALSHDMTREFTIQGDQPLSARSMVKQRYVVQWPGTEAVIESSVELSGGATHFHLTGSLDVFENDQRFASLRFNKRIDRDML
jgi:hypothetical protein